ncbi:MAG: hypothetical protein QOD63_1531, partial [Actinomycetota bacterium]|nr:hypothetical protein [Actinomycetota bacterium]
LEDIERFQWVAHRRRSRRTRERLTATAGGPSTALGAAVVPESLSRRVVPFAVLATGALCVLVAAADLATGIAGLVGADIGALYGASHSLPRTLAAFVLGAVALWAAIALVGRRLPLHVFVASLATVFTLTLATPWLLSRATWAAWAALPSALVGVVVLLVSVRSLAAWLPPRLVRGGRATLALDGPVWWRRPAARAVVLSTGAMTLLLLATILPLAGSLGPRPEAYNGVSTAFLRYTAALGCLDARPDDEQCPHTAIEAERSWHQARAAFLDALAKVSEDGSPAAADAARKLEATIPPSVEEARQGGLDYASMLAFLDVTCHEMDNCLDLSSG